MDYIRFAVFLAHHNRGHEQEKVDLKTLKS
jgi:hypothetical protein